MPATPGAARVTTIGPDGGTRPDIGLRWKPDDPVERDGARLGGGEYVALEPQHAFYPAVPLGSPVGSSSVHSSLQGLHLEARSGL